MSENSSPLFTWERRVEFCETDAAGICHFSSFFVYMEQAEHALFRYFGWSIFPTRNSSASLSLPLEPKAESTRPVTTCAEDPQHLILTWPRVHCSCDFVSPARFEDLLTIELSVDRIGEKSITYHHVIKVGERLVAQGKVITVCSHVDPETGKLLGCKIPDAIRGKLISKHL